MNEATPPRVVVLGGGSAGWITACLLHRAWGARGGSVTVVESSGIGIIGVGEGSTPQLKGFFDHLGIAEAEWMAACDATYKLGIRFTGWSEREGFESYFHPFPGPVDLHSEPGFVHNCMLARRGFDVPAHPDDWFLATDLAKSFEDAGVAAIIYTDINRDGAMQGPNIDATAALARAVTIPVIASGGVSSLTDLISLRDCGAQLNGAISGRALYDGALDLGAALEALRND